MPKNSVGKGAASGILRQRAAEAAIATRCKALWLETEPRIFRLTLLGVGATVKRIQSRNSGSGMNKSEKY